MAMSYTGATAFLEALYEYGVEYVFVNLGSDHPSFLEESGRKLPKVITAPHEFVAVSAAQGYAQVTGEPQCVVVHVECGTQNIGGAMHNGFKGRIPTLIFAGSSPYTQEGEHIGSRTEFIHWIQDVHDQRGIVRGYTKYNNELRSAENIKQVTYRALQFAMSPPYGPAYLVGPREVMENPVEKPVHLDKMVWGPIGAGALPTEAVDEIVAALSIAQSPIVICSYLGRNKAAVPELAKLCENLGLPVFEACPQAVNISHSHFAYQGPYWNGGKGISEISNADFVLVLDSDVPWIPANNKPNDNAKIYHLDIDPLKETMPLWYISARGRWRTDNGVALRQINAALESELASIKSQVSKRINALKEKQQQRNSRLAKLESISDKLNTPYVMGFVRNFLPKGSVIMNEAISNFPVVWEHIQPQNPGDMYTSGAGSLGWGLGAALGASLAVGANSSKGAIAAAIVGDGCFMFGIPSSVFWIARRYDCPILTIVLNNSGWISPKLSAMAVYSDGKASRSKAHDLNISFDPAPDYGMIAAASGAWVATLSEPKDAEKMVKEAISVVQGGRSALLNVILPKI